MTDNSANNKRIAINTILLYIRMLFTMVISLYTSRVILQVLGADDFGIYNAVDDEYAESVVYKKVEISKEIEDLEKLRSNLQELFSTMDTLSVRWKKYLENKEKLPKKKFSREDDKKIATLRSLFIKNLRQFGYKSLTTMEEIEISKDSYLPVRENFDMKFDSSASDGIRAIWAFTLALMQTSIIHKGNHPNILMYR